MAVIATAAHSRRGSGHIHSARAIPARGGGHTKRIGWFIALTVVAAPARAQVQLPQPVGYVNDFANVIPADAEDRITRIIDEVRTKSGGEIVVVTLPSLEGRTRDEVALQIGREWRIGQKGQPGDPARNTGIVVLVVPKETSPDGSGHLKIETGLGTSTFITASEAGRIADNLIIPEFRAGDYGEGILHWDG